ncbi:ATP-dependent zinc metalloprotease FtsH 2 [archaeon]|nr:ATP-dependent zinc metalloprotease FtsH 2 [archaeon]
MYVNGGSHIQTFLDEWLIAKTREAEQRVGSYTEARPARFLKLKPAGYPLKDFSRNYPINVSDEKLFEIYAKEQWMGATIKNGDFLFDQRLIPDFAFRVIKVLPAGDVMITENTRISLEKNNGEGKLDYGVKFSDVIGHVKIKDKCKIIMQYLQEPEKFGYWAPRNVLFYGPPGTGKTMTAKALASETSANLFMIRATELIGEYVGDGSKRIHELYSAALSSSPSIIFIDELDAVGLDRSYQSVRGDVSEIVNALLTELEGINDNAGIVTIAATNNPVMLDRALRSRFEEELSFELPGEKERLEILKFYSARLPLKLKANLRKYSQKTKGFSGRDLKDKLLKVSLHRAMLDESKTVTNKHLDYALKQLENNQKVNEMLYT